MPNLEKIKNFIERAEKIHHGKYDYSKVTLNNLKCKVEIICPHHGSFHVKANAHLFGYNCRKCYKENIPTKITKEIPKPKKNTSRKNPEKYGKLFIEKGQKKYGEKYDYSKVVYLDAKSHVIITCKLHGDFKQKPQIHLTRAGGCQMCSGREDMVRCDQDNFIKKARKIHGDRYDYSLVKYKNKISSVTIICREHGKFRQPARNHLKGRDCHSCSKEKLKSDEVEVFKKIKQIHGNKYKYIDFKFSNMKDNIKIVCSKHGMFKQQVRVHLRGSGCRKCFVESRIIKKDYFIKNANKIFKNKYDYSLINIKKCDNNIIIICPKHGEFKKTPRGHLLGQGCQKCAGCEKITKESFMSRSKKIHEDKYDYSKVEIVNPRTKVTITCPKHGDFLQSYMGHLAGQGCPKCANSYKKSKIEIKWIKSLKNENIILDPEFIRIGKRRVIPDGYDPTTKTIYEFHGDYWHGNPAIYDPNDMNDRAGKTFGELYKRTVDREALIKKAGYNLVTIWESDFKKSLGETVE